MCKNIFGKKFFALRVVLCSLISQPVLAHKLKGNIVHNMTNAFMHCL